MALSIRLNDIDWESVRDVLIDGNQLEILTDEGSYAFNFATVDELSEGLLILALKGTKGVRYLDDHRFNPARFT